MSDGMELVHALLSSKVEENSIAVFLDQQYFVLGIAEIGMGNIASVSMPVRNIAQRALLCNASHVIVAHNHPSGHCIPSDPDLLCTSALAVGLSLFEINLLDAFVVSQLGVFSIMQGAQFNLEEKSTKDFPDYKERIGSLMRQQVLQHFEKEEKEMLKGLIV